MKYLIKFVVKRVLGTDHNLSSLPNLEQVLSNDLSTSQVFKTVQAFNSALSDLEVQPAVT